MVNKRGDKSKYNGEYVGLAGFVMGVLSIVFLGSTGILISIVGFFMCLYQQKKKPMNAAKIGMILNIIGFVAGIIITILFVLYLVPFVEQFSQLQNFP